MNWLNYCYLKNFIRHTFNFILGFLFGSSSFYYIEVSRILIHSEVMIELWFEEMLLSKQKWLYNKN